MFELDCPLPAKKELFLGGLILNGTAQALTNLQKHDPHGYWATHFPALRSIAMRHGQ